MHRDLAASTAMQHAVTCHFTHPNKLNIVIAKGNILSVYLIYTTTTSVEDYPVARMELIKVFTLQGTITSLSAIKTGTSVGLQGLHSLLLTFKHAKMSLIEYSDQNHNLVTVSMHHYEKEEYRVSYYLIYRKIFLTMIHQS